MLTSYQKRNPKKNFFSRHRKMIIVCIVIFVIIVCCVVAAFIYFNNKSDNTNNNQVIHSEPVDKEPEQKPKPKYYSSLNGSLVTKKSDINKPISAVMIENTPPARPQSGLADAEVVYEAIAEGGITRFMALYQQNKPDLIGPVRSLRPYYIDWFTPYQASIFHVGGSRKAKREVRSGAYRDMDQFFNSGSYWRSSDRYAPHNIYTSSKKVDQLNASKGYIKSEAIPIKRVDESPSDEPTATSIQVNISGPTYNSHYDYDSDSNMYLRSEAGKPQITTQSKRVKTKVLVVMKTSMNTVKEDKMREVYKTSGSGQAWIFQNGTVQKATWNKANREGQLHLTDKNGDELRLVRGKSWFVFMPMSGSVSWQ